MLHRGDGAVVCDIVGHVVGDRLDLGHGVAHGHSRLDGGEHAQVVARIAKAKGALVASAAQILQRPRHAHALVDALGAQLAVCLLGSLGRSAVNASPSQSGTAEANPTRAPPTQRSGGTHLASRRTVTRPGGHRDEPLDLRKLLGDDAADVLSLRHHAVHLEEAVVAAAIANRGGVNARILQPLRE